jgi:hypothetical protein
VFQGGLIAVFSSAARPAWPDEIQMQSVLASSVVDAFDANSVPLWAAIDCGTPRRVTILSQRGCGLFPTQRGVGIQRQALADELDHHGQHSDPAPVSQSSGHEIHAPALIRPRCQTLCDALPPCPFLALLCAKSGPLRCRADRCAGVYFPSLTLQQHRQAAITVGHAASGQLAQPFPQPLLPIAMMF